MKVEEEEKKEGGKGKDGGTAVAALPLRTHRKAQITERDIQALGWLVEQRVASVSQVRRLLEQLSGRSFTDRRTWQIIARWEAIGLAERWRVWHGEQALVWPTAQAANLAGLSRWRRPGVGTLRHLVAVSEVRLQAAPHGGPRRWITESELRRTTATGVHLADGAWVDPNGSTVAIEVELTQHGKRRVESAIKSLLAEELGGRPRWNHVIYVCSTVTLTQVRDVVEAMPPASRSRVQVRDLT